MSCLLFADLPNLLTPWHRCMLPFWAATGENVILTAVPD